MTDKTKGQQLSETFRTVSGLDKRKNDKPTSGNGSVTLATEPEGGYGGNDGISNSAAINASEQRALDNREAGDAEKLAAEAEKGEVEALTPDGEKESEADAKTGNVVKTADGPAKKSGGKK